MTQKPACLGAGAASRQQRFAWAKSACSREPDCSSSAASRRIGYCAAARAITGTQEALRTKGIRIPAPSPRSSQEGNGERTSCRCRCRRPSPPAPTPTPTPPPSYTPPRGGGRARESRTRRTTSHRESHRCLVVSMRRALLLMSWAPPRRLALWLRGPMGY
jgi:hypothetical protein